MGSFFSIGSGIAVGQFVALSVIRIRFSIHSELRKRYFFLKFAKDPLQNYFHFLTVFISEREIRALS
jgi:hypothetical protein